MVTYIYCPSILHRAENLGGGLGDFLVILHSAPRHPDAANDEAPGGEGKPPGEGDQAGVGVLDVVEAAPWLRQGPDHLSVHLEEGGGLGLLDGDVHASQPRPVHSGHISLSEKRQISFLDT